MHVRLLLFDIHNLPSSFSCNRVSVLPGLSVVPPADLRKQPSVQPIRISGDKGTRQVLIMTHFFIKRHYILLLLYISLFSFLHNAIK